jgi:hypothetical protein
MWTGTAAASSGQCKVAWPLVTRPIELGGLGVLDLVTMGYALYMCWEWLTRTQLGRTWNAIDAKPELAVCAMFDASVRV